MQTKDLLTLSPADEIALSGFSARSRELLRHVLTSPEHQAEFQQSEAERVAARRRLGEELQRARDVAQLATKDTSAEKRLSKLARELELQREQLKAAELAFREAAHLADVAVLLPSRTAAEIERTLRRTADERLLHLRIELQRLTDTARFRLYTNEIRTRNFLGLMRMEYSTNADEVNRAIAELSASVQATFDLELAAISFDEVTEAMVRLCGPELTAALKPLDLSPPWIHAETFQVKPAPAAGALADPKALKPKA